MGITHNIDKTQYGESNDENVAEITSVAAVSSNAITSTFLTFFSPNSKVSVTLVTVP